MPHQTEPSANTTLGNLLQPMLGKALDGRHPAEHRECRENHERVSRL